MVYKLFNKYPAPCIYLGGCLELLVFQFAFKNMITKLESRTQLSGRCSMVCLLPCLNVLNFIFQVLDMPDLKRVRSAARALLSPDENKIPLKRKKELEEIILQHFGAEYGTELSRDMLLNANRLVVR